MADERTNAPDWDELKAVFDKVRSVPRDQRSSLLDIACRGDSALRSELDLLLSNYDEAPGYFGDLARAIMPTSDSVDPLVGQRISHYEIVERLGKGGMGVVYKARHLTLDHLVALKFLNAELSADDKAKLRFIQEARTTYALEHPNIGTIYDIEETEAGRIYIAMAFYEGETLAAKIRRGPLSLAEALDYAAQVCEALAKAHGSGIVHRDLKPSNVMITQEGVAKLLDFGVARITGTGEDGGRTMGTIAYMSPEQTRGEEVDQRADIWSFGVIFYEMLTGRHPFRRVGDAPETVIRAVRDANVAPVRRWAPDVTLEVDRIIAKCLARGVAERYQTSASLFADLHQAERSRPATTPSRSRIFLTYRYGVELDERVAGAIRSALGRNHEVHVRRVHVVGARWMEQLETDLANSDFLIVLISERGAHSEMVAGEVELAARIVEKRGFGPTILPVRLDYNGPLPEALGYYLEGLPSIPWADDDETPRLVDDLKGAMAAGRLHTRVEPTAPSGQALSDATEQRVKNRDVHEGLPISKFYIERKGDRRALAMIEQDGVTITIKGPRQMGKTSLLMRVAEKAEAIGKAIALLNVRAFRHSNLQDADAFFKHFCARFSDALGVDNEVESYWKRPVGNPHRCTRYISRHVLHRLDRPVVLAMDEVEQLFDTPFQLDFFGMLRSWHNDRAVDPTWRKLDLLLATSTEPYELLRTPNLSPFNVGEIIALEDFSVEQVSLLNRRYGDPLSREQVAHLTELVHGHPNLIHTALFAVAEGHSSYDDLVARATERNGPFEDHLSYHLLRLSGREEMIEGMRQVLRGHRCEDERVCIDLIGAGLVRRDGAGVVPRCLLYADYFGRLWRE